MTWAYTKENGPETDLEEWNNFAVLEFKSTKMIHYEDFKDAIFSKSKGLMLDQFKVQASRQDTMIQGDEGLWLGGN